MEKGAEMKTPYREYPLYERDINPENGDIIMGELNPLLYDTRWKRRNRVKQLKQSLKRYKYGTNLDFYSHELHAYMLLQELKTPGKKASANEWSFYTHRLLDIHAHIMQAIAQASRETGAGWEREEQNRRDAQKLFQEKIEEHLRTKERKDQKHE